MRRFSLYSRWLISVTRQGKANDFMEQLLAMERDTKGSRQREMNMCLE